MSFYLGLENQSQRSMHMWAEQTDESVGSLSGETGGLEPVLKTTSLGL